ncbi:MAG: glycerol-3-phosphate dehydrogenase [Spirochaetia bacterium]|nr:glycerol-3-phosphate dehydrogenase [Spirochaetia bacterium]
MEQHTIMFAGAGVFATAMAERLAWNKNNTVFLYSRDKAVVNEINDLHQNKKYYPTRFLNKSIVAFDDLPRFAEADYIFIAIPSKAVLPFFTSISKYIRPDCLVINLAKGMNEDGTFVTSQIPAERVASMKGPTFAIELMNGSPSAFTFGGRRRDYIETKKEILDDTLILLDYSDDTRAVELLSVLKNMYAIAIGLVSGRFNSPNVDFLIYTKAVREMRSFLKLYEADPHVIYTYCGVGDLGLTGLNDLSRNRTLGLMMGKGFRIDTSQKSSTVLEGLRTVKLMQEITQEKKLEVYFPIVNALYSFLYEHSTIQEYEKAVFV